MLFVLCQFAVVAVALVLCALTIPGQAPAIAIGLLAVVVTHSVITLMMRRANPGALVFLALLRSFVVAFVVILGVLVLEPQKMPYLIGAGVGIGVITFVPIALTMLRPEHTRDAAKA